MTNRSLLIAESLLFSIVAATAVACHTPRSNQATVPQVQALPIVMPARVIYLARHGRSRANALGQVNGATLPDRLDRVGYQQRVGLYVLLRSQPIAAIFTSSLLRTQQTAMPLARHLRLRMRVESDLDEFHGGVFEGICSDLYRKHRTSRTNIGRTQTGRSLERLDDRRTKRSRCAPTATDPLSLSGRDFIRAQSRKAAMDPLGYRAPGGGESVRDVMSRLRRFLAGVSPSLRDKTILIVGHGGTNRFLLGILMHWAPMAVRAVRQKPDQIVRMTRQTGRRPRLEVWTGKAWRPCREPPDPHRGLTCLRPVARPPARPVGTTFPTQ